MMKSPSKIVFLKNFVYVVLITNCCVSNSPGMENYEITKDTVFPQPSTINHNYHVTNHYQDDISYNAYHKAISGKLAIIGLKAQESPNEKKANNAVVTAAKQDGTNPNIEINLPVFNTQTIDLGPIGEVTIITRAASFCLLGSQNRPKDYYHIVQEGIFYPKSDITSNNKRIFGFRMGAFPTKVTEIRDVPNNVTHEHNLYKLSIIQTSPENTLRKKTYTSQVALGFNLGLSVTANVGAGGGGGAITPSVGFNFTTTHTKSVDIEDISVRNLCGSNGQIVDWVYEMHNLNKNIHTTSPSSRSSVHAYNQWIWAVDYHIQNNADALDDLASIQNPRSIQFTPFIEVEWGKVSKKCLSQSPKYKKKRKVKAKGNDIVVILSQADPRNDNESYIYQHNPDQILANPVQIATLQNNMRLDAYKLTMQS